ncbi:MAG: hypothetical protein ACREOL_06735 [Candidatus Dormibacteria bacterium]
MTSALTSAATIRRAKLTMVWGLALLWVLDTGLQAQPQMFSVDLVSMVMKPSIAISPSFLFDLSNWTLGLVSAHVVALNAVFVAVQLAIAVSLLLGLTTHRERLLRYGLLLTVVWGLGVWVFGEGTSGVFTGNGTMVTGAPGSVLLYVAIAVFYFLPPNWWQLSARFCLPRDFLALVFLYGALAQYLTPGFWGVRGLPILLEGQASMAPNWMVPSLIPLVTFTHAEPVLSNALLATALLLVAVLLYGRSPKAAGFVLMAVVLGAIWYWGQAIGGIFSGMGTDPNTIPPLALLAVPAGLAWSGRHRLGRGSWGTAEPTDLHAAWDPARQEAAERSPQREPVSTGRAGNH